MKNIHVGEFNETTTTSVTGKRTSEPGANASLAIY
jgi:hypothetical protein